MMKVLVTKNKLDTLAEIVGGKSNTDVPLTLDEMITAADSIYVGKPILELETVTKTYTPSTSAVTDTITPSAGYDGIEKVDVTVSAMPTGSRGVPYWMKSTNSTKYILQATFPNVTAGYISSIPAISTTLSLENKVVEPTESQQTIAPTDLGCYLNSVTINAIPSNYVGSGVTQRASSDLTANGATVTAPSGYYASNASASVQSGSVAGPTSQAQVSNYSMGSNAERGTLNIVLEDVPTTPIVSAGYVSSASSSTRDVYCPTNIVYNPTLTVSGATITAPAGYYPNNKTKTVESGTEGTPIATKGSVSNHAISITPSVTNSAGYISGGTHNGTAVFVSASELVSGSETKTENGTYDVTNLAELVVNVSGGGSSSMTIGTKTATLSAESSSIQFTGLSGNPLSFVVTSSANQTTGGTKAVAVAYDGTSFHGMDITTQMENDTGFTKSYSSGTLTITATSATFEANEYKLVYTYGGSSSDIHTANVQVGSGATSITFTGLSGRPTYFSCVFKSTFSTSSGYQRVIDVVNDGTNTYGNAMDSSAKAQTSWSYSYSGGALTITSSSTNNGGYFHQPGYYQLTYAVDSSAPQYETVSKTYRASTSAQTDTIEPSSGYDAMSEVNISIPAVAQTNLTADNIKSGTTVTISNGQSNLWSVTGTYSGGGGSSMNTQTVQSTSRRNSTSLGSITSLTCSKAGTYDIYWTCTRSNTSQTWGSQLYINNSAYGTENTTWSNNVQNNKLTGVTLSANQTVAVYGRSRNGYYIYAPQLTIVQTA